MIRTSYDKDPGFPATDQHPDCLRTTLGGRIVDYIGAPPTLAELQAILNPPPSPPDPLEIIRQDLKADPTLWGKIKAGR